jgi:hypothetical protein
VVLPPERGPEGREGPAGREGVAGREGQPGISGVVGEVGPEGRRGKQGAALPGRVRLSFVALTLVFALSLAVIGYYVNQNRKLIEEGQKAHDALCVIRENLSIRVGRTQQFLDDNPAPLIAGIPRELIQRGVDQDMATLIALDPLECVPPPQPTSIGGLP